MKLKLLSKMKMLLGIIFICLASISGKAQTSLTQGDVAFIGYTADGTDSFTFIITRVAGIASGTVIKFTDNGWLGTVNCGSANHFRTGEGEMTWTASGAMSYLDVVTIASSHASQGNVTGTMLSLATGGDQIFAFQGTFNSSGATIIAGIQMNSTGWEASSTSNSTSALPNCLTNGTDAVANNPEVDNAAYDCSVVSGTRAVVLAAINGNPIDNGVSSNWITNNGAAVGQPACAAVVTSTTWNGSTWSNGAPTSSVDAIIASSTTPGSSFTCEDLTINSGFSLTMSSSVTATIHGTMTNSGNGISGAGNLTFAKSGSTTLAGTAFSVLGTVTVNSGCTLNTASKLTLASNASNTGRIGNSAGTLSGNVTVQRYMPGKRAFRFFGHPFTTSQALTILTDDIDITGSGGAANGFTATTTNNPSAFWFDVSAADNTTAGNNPGWTAFTNTNGASANSWDKAEFVRLLVRGAKGEGLTGASYTPSAVTIDMTGTINTGTQTITLTKGSGSTFVSCSNPLPSPVQMNTVSKGSNIGANYYVWDATSGASGAYITNAFTTSYILPMGGALFTTASANSSNTLEFQEADKSSSTPASIFKTTAAKDWVELLISDSTLKWDRLLIHFDDNSLEVEDKLDAVKLYNPGLDFYTLSKDNERLAIDVRPYTDKSSIPLGLTAYNRYNKYVIRTGDYEVPAGTKLVLHDKYLNTQHELKTGFEYWFDVTADTLSQGTKRFEINMVGKPTNITKVATAAQRIQLVPNPAQDKVTLSFDELEGVAQLRLTNITGQVVYAKEVNIKAGSVTIPLNNIPKGMYIVTLQSSNTRFVEKLIKQ